MIKKGDILISQNHKGNWLTEGKEYLAQGDEYMSAGHLMYVNVENDKGRLVPVLTSRFTIKPKTMDTLTTTKQNVQSAIDAGLMQKELAQKLFPGEFEDEEPNLITLADGLHLYKRDGSASDSMIAVLGHDPERTTHFWLNPVYDWKISGQFLIPTRK